MRLIARAPVILLALVAAAHPTAGQPRKKEVPLRPIAPLDLGRTLDLYADGRFDEAVTAVAGAGDKIGLNLRRHWPVTGQTWIDADPASRPRRLLAAAALALETENLRAERGGWRESEDDVTCAAACVLDWAQLQLRERGAPDRAERAWYLAAAALAGGVRDWRYLYRPVDPMRAARVTPGLIDRALLRFPSDPALRLEHALAAAGPYNVIGEDGRSAAGIPLTSIPVELRGRIGILMGLDDPSGATGLLSRLAEDPDVGPEARLRLGYLHWVHRNHDASRMELTAAADGARDVETRYLAQFLLGWTLAARGESDAAIGHLEAALTTRPGSQSAAVLLAALELQRGDAVKADSIVRMSAEKKADLDPWRLFLYGHHPRLPDLIAALRREVAQ